MALLFQAPPNQQTRRNKDRPTARAGLSPHSGSLLRDEPVADVVIYDLATSVARDQAAPDWPEQAEDIWDVCATAAGFTLRREPTKLDQGFDWRRMRHTRPDRLLVELGVYAELTTGKTSTKLRRIQGAMIAAFERGEEIEIVLYGNEDILNLDSGAIDFWDLLAFKLDELDDWKRRRRLTRRPRPQTSAQRRPQPRLR